MDLFKTLVTISIIFSLITREAYSFLDPLSLAGISAIGSALYLALNSNNQASKVVKEHIVRVVKKGCQKMGFCEGCEDYWIPGNVGALEYDLKKNVFGQQLAVEHIIMPALQRHLSRHNTPDRPLVLSFHGSPGTGKNFVSTKIIQNMFKNQQKSNYVHFFRSAIDFPMKRNVENYKEVIRDIVMDKVRECHRSVFVFDEVEKMPNGILEVLSSFVSWGADKEYDFRRVIFILLSNVGEKALVRRTLEAWQDGVDREDMDLRLIQKELTTEAFNQEGGLKSTGLVQKYGISHYVPFLPLEKRHVIQCLETEVVKQGQIMSEKLKQQVLEELYFCPEPQNLFAFAGCKGVGEKASTLIQREIYRKKRSQGRQ